MKIATLNTWKNEGDYTERLRSMAALLKEGQYDIVLLQEVLGADEIGIHTGKYLAKACNYHLLQASSRRKLRKISGRMIACNSGLGTLCTVKSGTTMIKVLPSTVKGGERIAQFTEMEIDKATFVVGNLHLSHVHTETEIRKLQWQTAVQTALKKWPERPLLIGGDMNTDLDASNGAFDIDGYVVTDAFKAAYQGESPVSTCPVPEREHRWGRRIDTVFSVTHANHSVSFECMNAQIKGKTIPKNCNAYPSDHALVEIELLIRS